MRQRGADSVGTMCGRVRIQVRPAPDATKPARKEITMSDTGGSDPQFAVVPGAMTHRFRAAPVAAAPQGPEAIASELGAMADALEGGPFTAETLAARLEEDANAKGLAAIAGLALVLRDLSP